MAFGYSIGINMGKYIDITNLRFGRLIALKVDHIKKYKSGSQIEHWLCQCDCGNKTIVNKYSLISGNTKSCGCLNSELASVRNSRTNRYENKDDYIIGYDYNNNEFYFDKEDFDKVKIHCWHIDKNHGYPKTVIKGVKIYLHNYILPNNKKLFVDHINGNKADNRKNNLRFVTASQNLMNTKLRSDNVSGYKGVYYNKKNNRWYARITVNKKTINLGSSKDKEDAIKMRKEAEEKYFGEYSYDNSRNSS